jgi:quinol monooxygenase YgiN
MPARWNPAINRRAFVMSLAGAALVPARDVDTIQQGKVGMFGLIGKMTAAAGQRDALIAILLEGTGTMPGCLSYVVALDRDDPDAIWITEVWKDEASHRASLSLPAVRDAIAMARPLIAGFSNQVTTTPVGGQGL